MFFITPLKKNFLYNSANSPYEPLDRKLSITYLHAKEEKIKF